MAGKKTAFIDRLYGVAAWVREATFLELAERGLAVFGLLFLLSIPWEHSVRDDVSHHVMVGDYNKRMNEAAHPTTTVTTAPPPTTTSTTVPPCPACPVCFGPPAP